VSGKQPDEREQVIALRGSPLAAPWMSTRSARLSLWFATRTSFLDRQICWTPLLHARRLICSYLPQIMWIGGMIKSFS